MKTRAAALGSASLSFGVNLILIYLAISHRHLSAQPTCKAAHLSPLFCFHSGMASVSATNRGTVTICGKTSLVAPSLCDAGRE